jgi:hypothetical protein
LLPEEALGHEAGLLAALVAHHDKRGRPDVQEELTAARHGCLDPVHRVPLDVVI